MHRTAMTAAWVVAGVVALSSCSTGWGTAPVASSTVSSPPGAASSEPTANTAATQVVVTVSMDGRGWRAHLNDSQAAQALASRLPLTLTFPGLRREDRRSGPAAALRPDALGGRSQPRPDRLLVTGPEAGPVLGRRGPLRRHPRHRSLRRPGSTVGRAGVVTGQSSHDHTSRIEEATECTTRKQPSVGAPCCTVLPRSA